MTQKYTVEQLKSFLVYSDERAPLARQLLEVMCQYEKCKEFSKILFKAYDKTGFSVLKLKTENEALKSKVSDLENELNTYIEKDAGADL